MTKYPILIFASLFLVAGVIGLRTPRADAAGPGAATNLGIFSQTCQQDGLLTLRFFWSPSYAGIQFFDITKFNNNFAFGFENNGPLAPGQSTVAWFGLEPNTRYFIRVNTLTVNGWSPTDTVSFVTGNCLSAFSPPTEEHAHVQGPHTVQFHWTAGVGYGVLCIDTALSQSHLVNFGPSWRNWGCGTPGTTFTATGFACDTTYYFRIWAAGYNTSGYTPIHTFTTGPCDFTPAANPTSKVLGPDTVEFSWERGSNNQFFCVDTADTEYDLTHLSDSWANHGCRVTGTTFTATDVVCGKKQYWRVWAAGVGATGYSSIATFTTPACTNFTPPTSLTSAISGGKVRFEWDAGRDNLWFCVDTATNTDDLNHLTGSWQNWGCGTTSDFVEVPLIDPGESGGLVCPQKYYWRVFARGNTSSGTSVVKTVETGPPCP